MGQKRNTYELDPGSPVLPGADARACGITVMDGDTTVTLISTDPDVLLAIAEKARAAAIATLAARAEARKAKAAAKPALRVVDAEVPR